MKDDFHKDLIKDLNRSRNIGDLKRYDKISQLKMKIRLLKKVF